MGTYGLDGVLLAWRGGTITTEQAVGQILLLLQEMSKRLDELEKLTTPLKSPPKEAKGNGPKSPDKP
jgi:hypothetical protein